MECSAKMDSAIQELPLQTVLTILWVMETELMSFARVANVLKNWADAPGSYTDPFILMNAKRRSNFSTFSEISEFVSECQWCFLLMGSQEEILL